MNASTGPRAGRTNDHTIAHLRAKTVPRNMTMAQIDHAVREINHMEAEWRIYASIDHAAFASDNGLSPVRREAIIGTNAVILLIGPLGTNFS